MNPHFAGVRVGVPGAKTGPGNALRSTLRPSMGLLSGVHLRFRTWDSDPGSLVLYTSPQTTKRGIHRCLCLTSTDPWFLTTVPPQTIDDGLRKMIDRLKPDMDALLSSLEVKRLCARPKIVDPAVFLDLKVTSDHTKNVRLISDTRSVGNWFIVAFYLVLI